jgi:multidrug resistance efflux pump
MKKLTWMILISLAAGLLAGCNSFMSPPPASTPPPSAASISEEVTVSASAEVVPEKYASLGMPSAGIIGEMLVKDGDQVSQGQVLMRLNGQEDAQAKIAAAEYALAEAQNALDILNKNAATKLAVAQKNFADAEKALKDAQDERYRKNLARVSQATIDQKQAELIIALDVLKKARETYAEFENKPENDVQRAQAFSALAAAQQKVDQITYDLNWLLSGPDKNEIARADAEIVVAQSRLADAQREYDLLKSGPDPAELKVAQARIANAKAQLDAAKKAQAGLELRAPFAGVVSDPRVHAGEYITFGQSAMELVDLSTLRVETTDLNETDVNRIKVGDIANVTFDALPGVNAIGKVVNIGTKVASGSGVNFTVMIKLDSVPAGLRWGMTAFVVIIVTE